MKKHIPSLLVTLLLILLAILWLFPVYIVLINSLKTTGEMYNSILTLPTSFYFENYVIAIEKLVFLRSFKNTLIISVIGVLGIVLCSSAAGYKLARTKS